MNELQSFPTTACALVSSDGFSETPGSPVYSSFSSSSSVSRAVTSCYPGSNGCSSDSSRCFCGLIRGSPGLFSDLKCFNWFKCLSSYSTTVSRGQGGIAIVYPLAVASHPERE